MNRQKISAEEERDLRILAEIAVDAFLELKKAKKEVLKDITKRT